MGPPGPAEGLVVLGGVDGELADEFAGRLVRDADIEVVGEDDDACAAVFGAGADVVHAAVDAQGDLACLVDGVASDSVMRVEAPVAGGCLRSSVIRVGRCASLG